MDGDLDAFAGGTYKGCNRRSKRGSRASSGGSQGPEAGVKALKSNLNMLCKYVFSL